MFEQCGDVRGATLALANLGSNACAARDFTLAAHQLTRSLQLALQTPEHAGLALVLDSFAVLATAQGQSSEALRLAGAAAALREKSQVELLPGARLRLESALAPARRALGGREAEDAFTAGSALHLSEAVALTQAPPLTRPGSSRYGLSRREMEVVVLIGRGRTNRQIAGELIIGAATVATHVIHIRNKLELSSRAQVAAWAASHGLLD
jgi:DNA-binding CsgD family transcriptional regulator